MSIRIGLYDFFAYTIPGAFYLITIGLWLSLLGVINVDLQTLNELSLFWLFAFFGGGYVVGLLFDPLADRWMRLFNTNNKEEARLALTEFQNYHPWVAVNFTHTDWGILLRLIKSKSLEVAADVEQHNVAAMTLRNISLGLILNAVMCLFYLLAVKGNTWFFILLLGLVVFSGIAMKRSRLRRRWFYIAVFQAFSANYLLDHDLLGERQFVTINNVIDDTPLPSPHYVEKQ